MQLATTLRDIGFRLGYDLDKQSEAKVENSIKSLKSLAKSALGAIGITLSISGLANLAQAAADVEAMKSQFSQVFGEVEENASKSLESIAEKTGIAENRIKGSFTQIAAFAKTTGADEADALAISERAMIAVADSAAFYDREIGAVSESLQSFLKGNFANDAALGLSCTETTRNAAANALYGKSFKDLSEQQKQLTLLQMVEDANKASGAIGQAARESDTWTNQLGNLKQTLQDLKATVGGIFLQSAVQILKKLAQVVKGAAEDVEWLVERLGGAEKVSKMLAVVLGVIFLKLNPIIAIVALLFLLVQDFITFLQGGDSLIGELLKQAGIDVDGVREKALAFFDLVSTTLPKIWSIVKSVVKGIWSVLGPLFGRILGLIAKVFGGVQDLIAKLTGGEVDTEGWERFGKVLGTIAEVVLAVIAAVKIMTGIIKVITAAKKAWAVVQGILNAVMAASPITWIIMAIIALIAIIILLIANWDKVKETVQKVWDKIVEVFSKAADWFKANVVDPIVNFFTGLWTSITTVVGNIKQSIVDGLTAAIDWIKALPEQALQWGKDIIMGIVNGIKNAVSAVGDAVKGVADKIKGFLGFSEPKEGPLSDFHTYMPDMIDLMSEGIKTGKEKVKSALEGLTGDMSVMAQANLVSGNTAAAATGGNNVNKSVVQNVSIANTFNGDKAGQAKSAAAMGSASDDAVSYMARALAFAR